MPSELDAAYLAGLIDGEGSIAIGLMRYQYRGRRHVLVVSVSTVDIEAIRELAELWGKRAQHIKGHNGYRDSARIVWRTQSATEIIRQIRPYLRLKSKHADLALEFSATLNDPEHQGRRVTEELWSERERIRVALANLQVKRSRGLGEAMPVSLLTVEKPLQEAFCSQCGKEYLTADRRSRYCSKDCKERARYRREIKVKRQYDKDCPDCGIAFTTIRKQQLYCSPKCGPHGRNSKRGLEPTSVKH